MKKITSILLSVAMLLTMTVMFTGCGGPSEEAIYPKSIVVNGANGHGKISDYLSDDTIENKEDIAKDMGNDELCKHYDALKEIYDNCKVEVIDGKNGKLSNGDTIILKISPKKEYNKEDLEKSGFTKDEISFEEFKYTVQGLKEAKIIEVKKKDIRIEYYGYSGSAKATATVDNNYGLVECELSNSDNLSNGDEITVTNSINNTVMDKDLYFLKDNSKKFNFTVSGLPEFPDTLDGIDTSEIDNFLNDYVENGYCEGNSVGDNLSNDFLNVSNKKKYEDYSVEISNVNMGKLQDDTVSYYCYKNRNRALYSKKLKIDYDVVATKYFSNGDEEKENLTASSEVIVYANVVAINGKLHLANSDYANEYSINSSDDPYLSDYKDNGAVLTYGDSDKVIDYICESNSDDNSAYKEYIKSTDTSDPEY